LSDDKLNRREFIERSVKAGTLLAATGAGAWFYYDEKGPSPDEEKRLEPLPDYSLTPVTGKSLAIVKGTDRKGSARRAVELLGGMERFVKKGEKVLLKPNVAFASSPSMGATTHPDIIEIITELCLQAGAEEVLVMDNPINDPAACFMLTGIKEAADKSGARVLYPQKSYFQNYTLEGASLIRAWPLLYGPLREVNRVIGLAPVKSHHRSGASMTMKNWYGLLGGQRNLFHQDIHTIITELALMVKPTLVLLDGMEVMTSNGPTGGSRSDLSRKNTMIASTDQVAADTFGATLLGLAPEDLPHLAMAEKGGAGTTDYESLNPLRAVGG
jgi:uncharacterized protein (DUF362 family)